MKLNEIEALADRRPGIVHGPDADVDVCVDHTRAALALAIWFNEGLPQTPYIKRMVSSQKKQMRYLRYRHKAKRLQEVMNAANKDLNAASHELYGKPHWSVNERGMDRVVEHVKGRAA